MSAAFLAGNIPKATPSKPDTTRVIIICLPMNIGGTSISFPITFDPVIPDIIPMIPPVTDIQAASTRKVVMIKFFPAPMARSIPICGVLSLTIAAMRLLIPRPPIMRATKPMAARNIFKVFFIFSIFLYFPEFSMII